MDPDPLEFEDSTTSTSSDEDVDTRVYESNDHFILELHNLKRDSSNTNANPNQEQRPKKLRKKKKNKEPSKAKTSSSSLSAESLRAPHSDPNKEEFYDAHESYHGLQPQPQSITTQQVTAQPVPNQNADPKAMIPAVLTAAQADVEPRTAISKPVNLPP
ncbi:uncharacterized protein LOC126366662 [Pectinophora gossypiella]|uniref:uncharacterized protein LOC126366662 n=1 Tax=Pectinophora gossypiella TaxID=13191 RepID=UPI00214E3961|nr:uncharacterized protein LOC126366662 [Pectinophora gossypiella]